MKHGGYNVTNRIVGTGDCDLGGCRDTTEHSAIQQRLDVKRQVCGSAMRDVLPELGFVHIMVARSSCRWLRHSKRLRQSKYLVRQSKYLVAGRISVVDVGDDLDDAGTR